MDTLADAGALVEVTARAQSAAEFEIGVLEVLRRRIGFDVAMFKRADGVGEHGLDPKIAEACRPYWADFKLDGEPVVRAALAQRSVAVDRDVLGMRRLERLSYYQQLMRPHRGTATVFICLTRGGSLLGSLCLGRTRGNFSAREQDYLRGLAPALSVCETAAHASRNVLPPSAAMLTRRERQVLAHLPLGHTNAQIALALGSAERTVRNQLSSIFEKLSVGSRAEAAALCVELGLNR